MLANLQHIVRFQHTSRMNERWRKTLSFYGGFVPWMFVLHSGGAVWSKVWSHVRTGCFLATGEVPLLPPRPFRSQFSSGRRPAIVWVWVLLVFGGGLGFSGPIPGGGNN